MKKIIITFSVLVILSIVFFFPKSNGGGGSCIGCENKVCQCLGFKKDNIFIGPWHSTCYGISHSCKVYKEGFPSIEQEKTISNITDSGKKLEWQELGNINAHITFSSHFPNIKSVDPVAIYFKNKNQGFALARKEELLTSPEGNSGNGRQAVILKTDNGGRDWWELTDQSWKINIIPYAYNFLDIKFFDSENGFISGVIKDGKGSIFLLRTIDGGETWNISISILPINEGRATFVPKAINYGSREFVYAIDGHGAIAQYDIQSAKWKLLYEDSGIAANLFFFNNASGHIIMSSHPKIISTMDAGAHWNISTIESSIFNPYFVNYNIGYANGRAGYEETFLKTKDGGKTWTYSILPIGERFGDFQVRTLYFTDERSGFIILNSGDILETVDSGVSWSRYENVNESLIPFNQDLILFFKGFDHAYRLDKSGVFYALRIK